MLLRPDYPTLRIFLDGMLTMMLVYTLISWVWHRKHVYSLYAVYMISILGYLHLNDLCHFYEDTHAHARQIQLATLAESVIQCLSFIIYGRFAILLMNLRTNDRVSVRLINAIAALSALLIIMDIGNFLMGVTEHPYQQVVRAISRYVLAACALATVPRILRLRNRVVQFFIVGTLFYVSGALLGLVMYQSGWATRQPELPFTFPMIPMEIGIVLETICVTIGISLLNRQTEREKIRYQAQLIEQLRENEQKQARLNGLRDEIARDLHDEMGSQLASISILSQTTMRYVEDERAHQRLITIGQTARQVMESMREIVWSLNSSSDSMQHLGLRIREIAHSLFTDSPVRLYIRLPETSQLPGLTEKQKREVYLIAKECLTNVLRHARAKRVGLHLYTEANCLLLTISDDGVGFDQTTQTNGLGLDSIGQRAKKLNAELRIESEFGEGTTITLTCPLVAKESTKELLLSEKYVLTP